MRKKKGSFASTAVAAACVAGLAGYAYFVEFKQRGEDERRKETDALVLKLEKEKLTRMELHRGGETVVMERSAGAWRLLEPVRDTVDDSQVDGLIDALLSERAQETVAEGDAIDWATYGLDRPVTRLVAMAADQAREVRIGAVKSFDGALYARLGDEKKVLLVGQAWDGYLSKLVTDLRDKRLLRAPIDGYDAISIRRAAGGAVKLVRRDGAWALASGGDKSLPVSEALVDGFVDRVKGLRAAGHVAEDKGSPAGKKFGASGAPSLEILKDGQPVFAMTVSRVKPSVAENSPKEQDERYLYATSSAGPVVFKLQKTAVDGIDTGPESFYDRTFPFRLATADVRKVEILNGATRIRAKLVGDAWALETPDAKRALVSNKVREIVDRVPRLEVSRFRGKAAPRGLATGSPATDRVIRLFGEGDKLLLQVAWGTAYAGKGEDAEAKLVDVRTSASDQTFSVLESSLAGLPFNELLEQAAPAALATKPSEAAAEKKN